MNTVLGKSFSSLAQRSITTKSKSDLFSAPDKEEVKGIVKG